MTKYKYWTLATLLVCLGMFLNPALTAAGDWSIARQADWSTHFRDVIYIDAQNALAVGDSGVIAVTSDGGRSWTAQKSGVTQNLQRAMFHDAKNGWIAGDEGVILHTNDGGNTWQKKDIGTGADITCVHFANDMTGWATGNSPIPDGARGTVYRTDDGGATWSAQTSIELALNDVYFVDENAGWAVGGRARGREISPESAMLVTKDGGKTWAPQELDLQNPLFSIYFTDISNGWTFGMGAVWETKDGGKTWASMLPPPPPPQEGQAGEQRGPRRQAAPGLRRGVFAGDSKLWGINTSGRLVQMGDDGSLVPVAVRAGSLTDVAFGSPEMGSAVGEYGTILVTEDGGQTWASNAKVKTDTLTGIAAVSDGNIWCVGSDNAVYQSSDEGQTWKSMDVGIRGDFNAISFADASNGWILARAASQGGGPGGPGGPPGGAPGGGGRRGGGQSAGVILKTSDGGKTWSEQARGPEYSTNSIHVLDPQNAYICGSGGTAFATDDGGTQWIQQNTGTSWDINGIEFIDPMNGFSVGLGGVILRTTDGGVNWTPLTTYTAYDLGDVCFVTEKKGWVVGSYGIILTTDDGGDTWISQRCYSFSNLNKVYFTDANRGCIVGDSGAVFETADGGKTWNAVSLPTTADFHDVKEGSDGSFWAVGSWGTVIKGAMD